MKLRNPEIKDNEAWKPFIAVVYLSNISADSNPGSRDALVSFINTYPRNLRATVALALSVVKWWLIAVRKAPIEQEFLANCGCCCYFSHCYTCPIEDTHGEGNCISEDESLKGCLATYNSILKVYTEYFNALPEKYKQRLA